MNVQEMIESMVSRSGAQIVYGEPVQAAGRTVIPVAKVAYGFGSGRGTGESGGGGGGIRSRPVGVVEISDAGTRFVPVVDYREVLIAVAAGLLMGFLLGRGRR